MLQGALTKLDGASSAKALTTFSRSGNIIIDAFIQSYAFIVSVGAIPLKLFFRKNLGERAFSPFAVVVCGLLYLYLGVVISLILDMIINGLFPGAEKYMFTYDRTSEILVPYLNSPIILLIIYSSNLAIKHFKKVFKDAETSEFVRYSYYRGESRYYNDLIGKFRKDGRKITDEYLRFIHEPKVTFRIGLIYISIIICVAVIASFLNIDIPLLYRYLLYCAAAGVALWVSAFCLYLEEFGLKLRKRARLLDLTDGEYDVAFLQAQREKLKLVDLDEIKDQAKTEHQKEFIV